MKDVERLYMWRRFFSSQILSIHLWFLEYDLICSVYSLWYKVAQGVAERFIYESI